MSCDSYSQSSYSCADGRALDLYQGLDPLRLSSVASHFSDQPGQTQAKMASNIRQHVFLFFCIIATSFGQKCGRVDDNHRFDCYPELGASQQKCEARGCCWAPGESWRNNAGVKLDVPYCYYPLDYPGYINGPQTQTNYGLTANLKRTTQSYYPNDIMNLKMDVYFETDTRLRVKIYDPNQSRYEVPIETPPFTFLPSNPMYKVQLSSGQTGFNVIRKANQEVIFNTTIGPGFIYCDQFIQISSSLSSSFVYGLGEHRSSLALPTDWQSFAFWARDQPPSPDVNLYGVHPFYINLESNGDAHGVFLLNSNAMDAILQPAPAITYRTIGGILDFYFFLGPDPIDVVRQYQEVIGMPFMPPMWALGFHLCRWGYGSANGTMAVVERMRQAKIPQDVQWNDIEYSVGRKDFTLNPDTFGNLPTLIADLHANGLHYMPIVDPAISSSQTPGSYPPYDAGVTDNIFTKADDGSIFIGKVWPGDTAFPDWFHPNVTRWWQSQAQTFHNDVSFDGMWLDMNEPSNFVDGRVTGGQPGCTGNNYDNPPFVPGVGGGTLYSKTLCPSAKQNGNIHYNVHSLYGLSEVKVSYTVLANIRKKRPFIISRSTFPSSGKYGGHWLGDNASQWPEMHSSITGILNFNMFGVPMVGADICGFNGDTNEELCTRWMQLGAFYPFSRNHNTLNAKDQDPAIFSKASQDSSRNALHMRYSLLPYLYTLFQRAHVNGSMVARPLFFNFPRDPSLYKVDTQFMLGGAVLVSPVLTQGATSVSATFPPGRWYSNSPEPPLTFNKSTSMSLDAPLGKINIHYRGGYIVPTMAPETTTNATAKNPVMLVVSLDESGNAKGHMYWDDGDEIGSYENGKYSSWSFRAKSNGQQNSVTSSVDYDGFAGSSKMMFKGGIIQGVTANPTTVTLNGQRCNNTYVEHAQLLDVECPPVPFNKPLTLQWD
ncbi:lysosomal alpha-glucosidase-like isoform X2 [Lytechinus pictus]|uniref:lysosomal alpha-glucosidase-like isoform X2 n=1 Tax=Lytechinus pictus TaxID=7653 RepID=UPI0030B9C026